jgi:hypothetical protein
MYISKINMKALNLKTLGSVLCCGMMLTSCHTTRQATGSRVVLKAESERYEAAISHAFAPESFQSKITMGMGNKSLKGALKMTNKKRLLLSVNAPLVGIEVARVEANSDSLRIVDKFDKCYVSYSMQELSDRIGGEVDLEAVQCLFTGRMYVPGRGAAGRSDFKRFAWHEEGEQLVGQYTSAGRYTLSYTLNAENCLAATEVVTADSSVVVRWSYEDHQSLNDALYPGRELLNVQTGGKSFQGSLTLGTPTVPAAPWSDFTPSRNYQTVTMPQLIETIKKLKE